MLDLFDKLDNLKDNSLANCTNFVEKWIKSRITGIKKKRKDGKGMIFRWTKRFVEAKRARRRRKSIHGARYRDTSPLVNLVSRRVPRGFQRAKPLISIIITSLYVFEPADLRCRVAQLMRIGAAYISGRRGTRCKVTSRSSISDHTDRCAPSGSPNLEEHGFIIHFDESWQEIWRLLKSLTRKNFVT